MEKLNVVLIVPTGIGAEIGGHAGDANPVAKLIGACCDKLITHPNVVNASDINEMPENTLYVEGSILDRFLRGEIYLREVLYNKILLVVNEKLNQTVNSVNAAKVTIGADIELVELEIPLIMNAFFNLKGMADGNIEGWSELLEQIKDVDFDALAIQSKIDVKKEIAEEYLTNKGGVNPWGGVEAKLSKLLSDKLDKPVAHSPAGDTLEGFNEKVDPRMSAELVSVSYLHCILKGLHKAPKIDYENGLSVDDVSFLITPWGCIGEPHHACDRNGVKIIVVKENKTVEELHPLPHWIIVENYWEAAGVLMAYKAGVNPKMLRRPL